MPTRLGYIFQIMRVAKKLMPLWALIAFSLACSAANNLRLQLPGAPTPTASATPTPSRTDTPTPSPTPTATPTPLPAARIAEGDHAIFFGDWEGALEEYQTALSDSSEAEIQSAALLGLGRTLHLSGDYEAAAQTLEQLLDQYPASPHLAEAHFSLARIYSTLGFHVEAASAYQEYLDSGPDVIDSYIYEWKGDALFQAGNYDNAIGEYQQALRSARLAKDLSLEIKIARSYHASGDYATAIVGYRDIYNRTTSDHTKAEMNLLIGQAFTSLGDMEQAYATYLDSVENYQLSYDSYRALVALVSAGIAVDQLDRGMVDYHAGQYGVALAAFDRYLQLDPQDPATGHYYKGLSYRGLGEHQSAIEEWERIIQNYPEHSLWADAWEQKAQTLWRYFDQGILATQTLVDFVSVAPNHPRAADFLFTAASISERARRLGPAAELWERVSLEYPAFDRAYRALFLAGITRYRLQDYVAAQDNFQRLLGLAANSGERAAAHFWNGKSRQAQGDEAGARLAWQQAADADPTGYYSERASDILAGRTPFTPPQEYDFGFDEESERAEAEAWMRTVFGLPEETDLSGTDSLRSDPRFQRGNILWSLGLYEEARLEFEDLRTSLQSDPAHTYRLANHLLELGLYRPAIFAARQVLTLAGMSNAETMNAPIYFNHVRFGTYYRDVVIPAAQSYDFHPLLLFSLIRQESLFEGFVRSSAGARGLMQIIPSTGQEVASNANWPPGYTAEDLYRPIVSIRLGCEYLSRQRTFLDGDLYAALAAYNGGPGNSSAWKALAPDDPDLFLEVIRFDETRNYIRGIYEIFNIYRRIYDRTP